MQGQLPIRRRAAASPGTLIAEERDPSWENQPHHSKYMVVRAFSKTEQVIKQIWISTRFGVLSRYPSAADKPFPFIRPVVLPPHSAVKRLLTIFQLAATRCPLQRVICIFYCRTRLKALKACGE